MMFSYPLYHSLMAVATNTIRNTPPSEESRVFSFMRSLRHPGNSTSFPRPPGLHREDGGGKQAALDTIASILRLVLVHPLLQLCGTKTETCDGRRFWRISHILFLPNSKPSLQSTQGRCGIRIPSGGEYTTDHRFRRIPTL